MPEIEERIYSFMHDELRKLESRARIINGMPDHIHLQFLLNPKHALSNIVKQLKGASSEFINRHELTPQRFSWQTGFSAYSVSESLSNRVYQYILQQKEHHKKQTFAAEYDDFIEKHGLQKE